MATLEATSAIEALPLTLLSTHLELSNYTFIIDAISGNFFTCLIICAGAVELPIEFGLPAANGLTKLGYLNSRAITSVSIIVPLVTPMVPVMSLNLSSHNLSKHIGFLDTTRGLILADSTSGVPFAVLTLWACISSIHSELPDAAYVDGASEWHRFRLSIAPLCCRR